MLAWERSSEEHTGRLYPSARFQIVCDLYLAEWRVRSQRLAEQAYAHNLPTPPADAATAAAAAAAHDGASAACGASSPLRPSTPPLPPPPSPPPSPSGDDAGVQPPPLPKGSPPPSGAGPSLYERERAKQILANQAKLKELGLLDLLKKPESKAEGKKRARPTVLTAPSRPSLPRIAKATMGSYVQSMASDDEEEASEDEDDENASGSENASDSEDEDDEDGEAAGGGSSSGAGRRGGGKQKDKKSKIAAALNAKVQARIHEQLETLKKKGRKNAPSAGAHKRKQLVSRGAKKSVLPGGRGFECPPNLGIFFDTAEEALTHAAVGRVFDDKGRTPCLWAGCNRTFSSTQVRHGMWINGNELRNLLKHEKEHIKGDAAATTGFECPEAGCAFADPTSAAVWAHAAEAHSIEHDTRRCLWAGCEQRFVSASKYGAHEGVHTGVFPFTCPACGKGHANAAKAKSCCAVGAACRCGSVFKGENFKQNFARHQNKCKMGAAPLPATTAAANLD